jgi:imidazolonepropionase-like amidohydrolase
MSTALTNCQLIDGRGGEPLSQAIVIIEGPRIGSVGLADEVPVPRDARVIDLAGRTVMPGLIDAHLHLTWYFLRPDLERAGWLTFNDARIAMVAVNQMQQLLDAGITSVRDVGSVDRMAFDLRWAVGEGLIRGPRIWAAGRMICPTGGHGSEHPGLGLEINGVDAARAAVREEIKGGADFIKIAILKDEWTLDELDAAVDQSHRMDRRVACHVNFPPSIANALNSQVDSVEHGCLVTDDELAQMREQGTFWVVTPLIYHKQFQDNKAKVADPNTPPEVAEQARFQVWRHEWIWENMPKQMLRGAEMGVKIVVGSDQLYPEIGIAALPLDAEMSVDIGLSPMFVLQAVTSRAAECLGWEERLGTVEPGKTADLIALDGDPLNDIKALQRVSLVIKDGSIEKDSLNAK